MPAARMATAGTALCLGPAASRWRSRSGRRSERIFSRQQPVGSRDLPSSQYADRLRRVPKAWEKAFEVNPGENDAVRASCMEFVLAGLYASDRISRSQKHGRITYEVR